MAAKADNPKMDGGRTEARERAVQLTYELEQRSLEPDVLLAEQVMTPDEYTSTLVLGTARRGDDIDEIVARYADRWPLMRMPALDRSALRVATFELMESSSVPTAVILNEAVEFAKTYSTDDSGRFVNGVLAAIASEVRP